MRISLNRCLEGTLSAPLTFTYYTQPTIADITPSGADALANAAVTITGQGFMGLSTDAATRAAYLRCGFGIVAVAAMSISDEQIVCPGLWRAPNADGTSTLTLTLNGLSHVERSVVFKPVNTVAIGVTVKADLTSINRTKLKYKLLSIFGSASAIKVKLTAASVKLDIDLQYEDASDAADAVTTVKSTDKETMQKEWFGGDFEVEEVSEPEVAVETPTPPTNPPILVDAFFGAAGLTIKVSIRFSSTSPARVRTRDRKPATACTPAPAPPQRPFSYPHPYVTNTRARAPQRPAVIICTTHPLARASGA